MLDNKPLTFEVFPWQKNFETGIKVIDEQHQKLVILLNQLAVHLIDNDTIKLESVFVELASYADHHFKTEEAIWKPYFKDDSWFEDHLGVHDSFIKKVIELKNKQQGDGYSNGVGDIINFLVHW